MYRLKLTAIAADNLKAIDSGTRGQILAKMEALQREPNLLGKALKGPLKEFRSLRAAGQRYRIIYKVVQDEIIVVVVAVGLRKEGDKKDIYELMKKLINTGLLKSE
jgi:mRNA interferase RelE/StbE